MCTTAHELSRAVRSGDQEWLHDWLEASLWDGRSWVLYCSDAPSDQDAPADEVTVYQTSLLHKVLEETTTDALPSILRVLLRHGADPHLLNEAQETTLQIAARRSEVGDITIPMLLRAGANIHSRSATTGNTVWHEWAQQSCPRITGGGDDMTRLFARALPINHGNHRNWTPLHFASCSNHAMANHLIRQYGANIHASTSDGRTPLHLACRYGSVLCVRHLLDAGAYMYCQDNFGRTPFHDAAVGGFLKVTELCQAALRYPSYSLLNWRVHCIHGTNVLHNAISHPSAVRVILSKDAPIEEADLAGWTAFHYAAWIGSIKSMELLLEKSPELLHLKDSKGRNPLHVACFGLPQATLLLEDGNDLAPLRQAWWSGATKDVTANGRWQGAMRSLPRLKTPPHSMWEAFHWKSQRTVVQWLLKRGSTVLAADEKGNLPLAYTSDLETIFQLVVAAVQEGLF